MGSRVFNKNGNFGSNKESNWAFFGQLLTVVAIPRRIVMVEHFDFYILVREKRENKSGQEISHKLKNMWFIKKV